MVLEKAKKLYYKLYHGILEYGEKNIKDEIEERERTIEEWSSSRDVKKIYFACNQPTHYKEYSKTLEKKLDEISLKKHELREKIDSL